MSEAPEFNPEASCAARLKYCALVKQRPFLLIDVGCRGGLFELEALLRPAIKSYGFDCDGLEIERLNAAHGKNENASYIHAMLVGPDGMQTDQPGFHCDIYARSAAIRAKKMSDRVPPALDLQAPAFTLDRFVKTQHLPYVDFIKIDTDGGDYQVLRGAVDTLQTKGVLGVKAECYLNSRAESNNLLRDIDRLMNQCGFNLFRLLPQSYARDALPLPFRYDLPASTVNGQVSWCDAWYFRDYGAPDYEKHFAAPTITQIVKQITLYDLFNYQDCAAEMILKYRDALAVYYPVDSLLDNLVPPAMGGMSYKDYMAEFEQMMRERRFSEFGRGPAAPVAKTKAS